MKQINNLIEKYQDFLPDLFKHHSTKIISLGEGNTRLIQLDNLVKVLKMDLDIYLKFEGTNPTGSFKDRGMTTAITAAKNDNKIKAVLCASTGNTSASAAAYAARAGLNCIVLIPAGKIASGKLVQAMVAGCKIIQINGNFDDAMRMVKSLANQGEIAIVNSINPFRLQGQKTIAFEVIEQLSNKAPDYHCLPVGNAGNITAHWMGYSEYFEHKIIRNKPKILGYQAAGAAPFVAGHPIAIPETVATAIRIGDPQSWQGGQQAIIESSGWFNAVTDQEILKMQRDLAENEGIFCEPASAASLAGLYKDYQNNKIQKKSTVVCTLTGHGLKDPDIILNNIKVADKVITIEPKQEELVKYL
jgi:threonine synthase